MPTAQEIALGLGGTQALWAAARATLDPGDEVLACAPYWPLAPGVFHVSGARVVEVPIMQALYRDASFDVGKALREKITPRTRAVYFASPNNPDGKVLGARELAQIADVAREFDLWVFADEVYRDYAFERPHLSFATVDPALERTVIVGSFSKSHALAGARVGYTLARAEIATASLRITTHAGFHVPVVAQRMCLDALAHGAAWKAGAREVYRESRDAALRHIRAIGLPTFVPDGGPYLFIDFSETLQGRPLRELLTRAIEQGVLLTPGEACGDAFATHARLCFTAVSDSELSQGIAHLAQAVQFREFRGRSRDLSK
jgi:N-succinyldiaminopimelate aminotransferase